MSTDMHDSAVGDPLEHLKSLQAGSKPSEQQLAHARQELEALADSARQAGDGELARAAACFDALLELAACAADTEGEFDGEFAEIVEFVAGGVPALCDALNDNSDAHDRLDLLFEQADDRWGDTLRLIFQENGAFEDFDDSSDLGNGGEGEDDEVPPADVDMAQLQAILSAVGEPAGDSSSPPSAGQAPAPSAEAAAAASAPAAPAPAPAPAAAAASPPAEESDSGDDSELSGELLEAFLDDAGRCMQSMEAAALAIESNPEDLSQQNQICRELHTLKGASASLGLGSLAKLLHETEEWIQEGLEGGGSGVEVEALLTRVDEIRQRINSAGPAPAPQPAADTPAADNPPAVSPGGSPAPSPVVSAPRPAPVLDTSGPQEGSQRVRSSQLDRLMDMLSELVMLRNRRQSGVERLRQVHADLHQSVTQLRSLTETMSAAPDTGFTDHQACVKALGEVANDFSETLWLLRDFFEPLAVDNEAVSRFIGQFRYELASLRRMPVSGLFRRLRRVIRDAAKSESKQVQLQCLGENTGLEANLQERLYEPLLHIVRNSVSHGIEGPEERAAAGKESTGTVTLEASGGGNLLQLEIRDDGRGLDYEGIRRRGIERGLLFPERPAGRQELAQLIFHPGFSTRDTASQVSGRGVGMDVVAATLEQMRGWIEIDSEPGSGTRIRLTIPLPSVIEHVMILRASGQLFGVPMQYVHGAGQQEPGRRPSARAVHIGELLGTSGGRDGSTELWILAHRQSQLDSSARGQDVAWPVLVDEIVGPEEVVVRPLPALLKHQPHLSGLTLSGNSALVLLLEPRTLARRIAEASGLGGQDDEDWNGQAEMAPGLPVLVADDSRTARTKIVRFLRKRGFEVFEAADGQEALETLSKHRFAAVFTDLEMPRVSGYELLNIIRSTEGWSTMPVIVNSSVSGEKQVQKTRQLGASAYLSKPLSDDVLADAVNQLLLGVGAV